MEQARDGWYDVRAFGAQGTAGRKDTAPLQAALDACGAGGGGVVVVPPGRYVTGTLWLRSRTELHLAPGAVLVGSPDRSDYNADDAFPENEAFGRENVTGAHLLIARDAEDVAITGQGTLDGASGQFFGALPPERVSASYRHKACNAPIRDWRPGQMVFFCGCRRVSVRDVRLLDAPYWTLFCLGCEDVSLRGLTVVNPPQTANGDGIDIDCCRNVTVSDCRITSGDDCIAVRGNPRRLAAPRPCENVVVSNCILSTPCNAIRIGVGDGEVRHCAFSNLVITDTRTAINMVCRYSEAAEHGAWLHDISFANLVVDAVLPVQVTGGVEPRAPAGIERVRMAGFMVRGSAGLYIGGAAGRPLRGFALTDWDLRLSGGTDNEEYVADPPSPFPLHGAPGLEGRPALPCALLLDQVEDVRLTDFRLRWEPPLGRVWRDALRVRDASGVRVAGSVLPAARSDGASVRRIRSREVVVE